MREGGRAVKTRFETDTPRTEVLEFVRARRGATFFHSPAWLEILAESFPAFRCGWLTARNGASLSGLMPVVLIAHGPVYTLQSLPFGTYGHPLAEGGDAQRRLLEAFFELARSPRCVLAIANLFEAVAQPRLPRGWRERTEECRLVRLDCTFEEYRSARISRKRRQLCNRCEREGVAARLLDLADIEQFYSVYLGGAAGWGGGHPYPRRFFESLFRRREEGVLVWGAFLGDALIAAHVDFYFGRAAQAWQAGIAPLAREFDAAAFLVLHAIREAIERGVAVFNLGSSGGDGGMIFFKESMGAEERRYRVIERERGWWRWLRRI